MSCYKKKFNSLEDYGFPESFDRTNKSDVFYFLTKLNKDISGCLTREYLRYSISGFPTYFPELYQEYKNISFPEESNDWKFCQKLWHFLQNDYKLRLGLCLYCKEKRTKFINFKVGYNKYCSSEHEHLSLEFRNNLSTSWLSKNCEEMNDIIQKRFYSRIKNSGSIKESYRLGHIKAEETSLKLYGFKNYTQTKEHRDFLKNTSKERIERINITKTKNNTFNVSKLEKELYMWFLNNNFNILTQYKSKEYPYHCDFYLIDYDLRIELQGSWTHGQHPFDKNNKEDIKTLEIWKSKNTTYYNNAINSWTIRDVKKRETAKKNNLKYLEIFSNKLEECINIINTYISKL